MTAKDLFVIIVVAGLLLMAREVVQSHPVPTLAPTAIEVFETPPPEWDPTPPEAIPVMPTGPSELTIAIEPGYPLAVPRTRHTATLLQNGSILLVGGSLAQDDFVSDEEILDTRTGESIWAAPLHTPRQGHTATLLSDGRVLVVGGYSLPQQWLGDAEIYDPSSNTWTVLSPSYPHGSVHTATSLRDGRVLVVGGCIGGGICTDRVDIFDPQTNTWTDAASLQSDRGMHTAQLLEDDRVLIAGGQRANGELPSDGAAVIYDPGTDTWTPGGFMIAARYGAESVKLPSGQILVAGGVMMSSSPPTMMNSVEIYDPDSNSWKAASPLTQARFAFVLKALPNGQVVALSGAHDWDCCWTADSFVHEIELYDPATDQWHSVGELSQPSGFATGILFDNGQVWIGGGQSGESGNLYLADTWLVNIPKY